MKNSIIIIISFLIVSCSTSHDVVHNGFLQKRKYKKGYNLSFKKKEKTNKVKNEDRLALVLENRGRLKGVVGSEKLIEVNDESQLVLTSSINENNIDVNTEIHLIENDDNSVVRKHEINIVEEILKGVEDEYPMTKEERDDELKLALKIFILVCFILFIGSIVYSPYMMFIGGVLAVIALLWALLTLRSYKKSNEKEVVLSKEEAKEIKTKEQKRSRRLSNLFTWLTALFPLFIIPAIILNIIVIKNSKEVGSKKTKNKAIWRLVALPFLAIIGLLVFLSVLEGMGVITSSAA